MTNYLEKDIAYHAFPQLFSYITVREESFGGFLFNPFLFNELTLNQIEMRIIELTNGLFSIKEIIRIISMEFNLSTTKTKEIVLRSFNTLGNYHAIKWGKQRRRDSSGFIHKNLNIKTKKTSRNIAPGIDLYSAPLSIIWDITYKCNLKCQHCLVDAGHSLLNELSLKEIKNIIDQIADMKIFNITFSGGEPLLRRDFFEILRYASKLNIGIKFSTNGFLVNDQVVHRLDSVNVFAVQISLDGIEKTHDTFRGTSGSYNRAVEALRRFIDAGYWTIMSCTVTKYNIHEIKSLLELAISLEVATFKLSSFLATGRGRNNTKKLSLSKIDTMNLAKKMVELKKIYGDKIQMEIDGTFPWLLDKSPTIQKNEEAGAIRLGCSAGRSQLVLSPDGKVFPCPFLHDFPVGDLREEKLVDIWHKTEIFDLFRNIRKEDLKGKCKTCEYVPNLCQGGCRAAAYIQSRDLFAEDPRCWYKLYNYQ